MATVAQVAPGAPPSGPLVDLLSSMMVPTGDHGYSHEQDLLPKRTSNKSNSREDEDLEEALTNMKLLGMNEEHARAVLHQVDLEGKNVSSQHDETAMDEGSLVQCVKSWMLEFTQGEIDEESLRDFNLKVRFQGHETTTPPDHLAAVLHVLTWQSSDALACAAEPRQPAEKARTIVPILSKWSFLVGSLYGRCDVLDVTDILASSICDGIADARGEMPETERDAIFVGIAMAIRTAYSFVSDDDLIAACHQLESESIVVRKFVEFLQADSESSGDDDIPS